MQHLLVPIHLSSYRRCVRLNDLSRGRTRSFPGLENEIEGANSWYENYGNNPVAPSKSFTKQTVTHPRFSLNKNLWGRQSTVDQNHGFHLSNLRNWTGDDVGGPFDSVKMRVTLGDSEGGGFAARAVIHPNPVWLNPWFSRHYDGPLLAVNPNLYSFPSVPGSDLAAMGTEAIARCKPTNNISNLAVDLFEIFRGQAPRIPGATFWRDRTHAARAAGGEYLNKEFGWEPLVSDIRKAMHGVVDAHELLKAYERNSGKVVRRNYEFPLEQTESTTDLGSSNGYTLVALDPWTVDASKSTPHLHRTSKFSRRTWFSGAFTYHLPLGFGSRFGIVDAAAKAGYLFGIELTPETLWQAAPWTWVGGWFSNIGSLTSILSDMQTDGLVLRYGYVMEHTLATDTYFLDGRTTYLPSYPEATHVTFSYERKRRVRATPFGFELFWPQFSPRQLAISAALGLTRLL